ncbi:MAG TPA: cysteine hydrolase [Candidatus Cybelea sp.]|nr:cysteine hydrolase [Candidatus Cybelea sp.]
MARAGTAVLALHYQNDVLHPDGKIRVGVSARSRKRTRVIAAARVLLDGARRHGVPVISVRIGFRADFADVIANCDIFRNVIRLGAMQRGSWGAEFFDGLGPLPGEAVISHNRISAFYRTGLQRLLRRLKTRRVVVAGIATNYVVEHTVRDAADIGYAVTVASDACSSGNSVLHKASLANMALLAEIAPASDIVRSFRGKTGRRT